MPNYPQPTGRWLGNQLADVKGIAAANSSGGTAYVVEHPPREAGDKRAESARGVVVAIIGNLSYEWEETPGEKPLKKTGLQGRGIAVRLKSGTWVNVADALEKLL
ncbi:MAG: hypothetical protein ACRDK7_02745 [Solirubrobacteraceae bacterium]